jgi:probable DNA metabolism protein
MTAYAYDGSFDGLLTVVAAALEAGRRPERIVSRADAQMDLFGAPERVSVDAGRVESLLDDLACRATGRAVRCVTRVGLSELPDLELALFDFIQLAFEHGRNVTAFHAHASVRRINEVSRKVGNEIHRYTGLLRFRDTRQDMLWAPCTPDHNVILPVAWHFRRRMPAERWIIHDVQRKLAVLWDGKDLKTREGQAIPDVELAAGEKEMQTLWKTFHEHIAIRSRTNPRLQRQHMPRRYWKYLVEMAD